jgi:hypothetical protein
MVCGCVDNSTSDRFCNLNFLLFSSIFSLTFLFFLFELKYNWMNFHSTILQVLKVLLNAVASNKFRGMS